MKESNPIKEEAAKLKKQDAALNYNLDQFLKKLNQKPTNVARNDKQGNYEYLAISQVQNLLNQYFLGRWQTLDFRHYEAHMQLLGTITLMIFNPITKEWITRQGSAATQIRCGRNDGKPIKNGLSMDLPRLQADCIKNAAKTIGKIFGADLNRKMEDHYKTHISNYVDSQTYSKEQVKETACKIGTVPELMEYWETNKIWQSDADVISIFEERKRDLRDGL